MRPPSCGGCAPARSTKRRGCDAAATIRSRSVRRIHRPGPRRRALSQSKPVMGTAQLTTPRSPGQDGGTARVPSNSRPSTGPLPGAAGPSPGWRSRSAGSQSRRPVDVGARAPSEQASSRRGPLSFSSIGTSRNFFATSCCRLRVDIRAPGGQIRDDGCRYATGAAANSRARERARRQRYAGGTGSRQDLVARAARASTRCGLPGSRFCVSNRPESAGRATTAGCRSSQAAAVSLVERGRNDSLSRADVSPAFVTRHASTASRWGS